MVSFYLINLFFDSDNLFLEIENRLKICVRPNPRKLMCDFDKK